MLAFLVSLCVYVYFEKKLGLVVSFSIRFLCGVNNKLCFTTSRCPRPAHCYRYTTSIFWCFTYVGLTILNYCDITHSFEYIALYIIVYIL